MKMLVIPHFSQVATGALEHHNDCGAASTLMMLRAYDLGKEKTVDQIYNAIQPSGDVALSASAMQILMSQYGLKSEWKAALQLHDVFDTLADGKPLLALIHYAPLVSAGLTQFKNFLGAHFVIVKGIDIENVAVSDPYRNDAIETVDVPHNIWMVAWEQASQDGNPQYCALIPRLPIQDLSVPPVYQGDKYNLVVNGINVRSGPSTAYPVLKILWRTTTPSVYIVQVVGEYGKLSDGGWVYVGKNPVLLQKSVTQ